MEENDNMELVTPVSSNISEMEISTPVEGKGVIYELSYLLEKLEIKPSIIIPTCFNKKLGISNLLKSM